MRLFQNATYRLELNDPDIKLMVRGMRKAMPVLKHWSEQRQNKLKIIRKQDRSTVTAADEEASKVLLDYFTRHTKWNILNEEHVPYYRTKFPDRVLYEEEYQSVLEKGKSVLLVDPLDGTDSFSSGSGDYSSTCCLMKQGRPYASVVAVPATGVLYYAVAGKGAYATNSDGALDATDVSPGSRMYATMSRTTSEFNEWVSSKNGDIMAGGSVANFCARVATGRMRFVAFGGRKPWDREPAALLARESGAQVIDHDGTLLIAGGSEKVAKELIDKYIQLNETR